MSAVYSHNITGYYYITWNDTLRAAMHLGSTLSHDDTLKTQVNLVCTVVDSNTNNS